MRLLTDKLSLDTTFYYVERHNEPVAVAGGFAPTGRQRSYGMELILKHEFTQRFFGWIAYTLSRAEQTAYAVNGASTSNQGMGALQTGAQGDDLVPDRLRPDAQPHRRRQLHVARLALRHALPPRDRHARHADVGGHLRRRRRPSTPAGRAPRTRRASPTFNQLDLRAERTWTFNAWQFGAYLDVQNVYNAQNPEFTIYDYRCRGSEPVRGIPFLPILGVRGIF